MFKIITNYNKDGFEEDINQLEEEYQGSEIIIISFSYTNQLGYYALINITNSIGYA